MHKVFCIREFHIQESHGRKKLHHSDLQNNVSISLVLLIKSTRLLNNEDFLHKSKTLVFWNIQGCFCTMPRTNISHDLSKAAAAAHQSGKSYKAINKQREIRHSTTRMTEYKQSAFKIVEICPRNYRPSKFGQRSDNSMLKIKTRELYYVTYRTQWSQEMLMFMMVQ